MRHLYLLRHAKSSWKDESLADFDRPLAGRGRRACDVIGEFITTNEIEFDLAVSSTAVRARDTIDLIRQRARLKFEVRYDERIYEAGEARLLEVISQTENDKKSVMLVGHNPGLEQLLQSLTGTEETFPTAALAKINLKISKWSESLTGKATLEWVVRPKELEREGEREKG
ncbi:MAG TPA: histidine phosphatase family protein [Pyrinomonadaceae bacterium]